MTVDLLLLVHANEQVREAVSFAAQRLPGLPKVLEVTDLKEALALPEAFKTVLILTDGTTEERQLANGLKDRDGRKRWAVVELGQPTDQSNSHLIPSEGWLPGVLVAVIYNAARTFEDRLVYDRHLGDLQSMERRIRHDLTSPLNAILGLTELIQDITIQSHPEIQDYTRLILDAIDGMVKTLERVGAVIRASVSADLMSPVTMQEVVWSAGQRLRHHSISRAMAGESVQSLPEVNGITPWLETVWYNLLGNSVTHGGADPAVEIGWLKEAGSVRFWVQDDGPGVPAEKIPQLFCPFDHLHLNNRARGLGLSIVHRLVSLQGGKCGYEAAPEGGARFYFTLPV